MIGVENKIGKFEAIFLMTIITINVIVLNIPNMIMLSEKSGSIFNTIYVDVLGIILSLIFSKLFDTFSGKDIFDISEYLGGKLLKSIVCICFIIFFIFLAIVSVKYLTRSIKIIYFNKSPIIFLLLFFIVPAVFINKLGLKAVSGANIVFVFIVLLSLLVLFISSYQNLTISKLFPICGNGLNEIFVKGFTNIFVFANFTFLFLLPSILKDPSDLKKVAISSTSISAIIILFCITTFILTLPTVTESDEILSIYLLTRMVSFGNFLERLDAFFIFSWIITLLSSLSIGIFYIIRIISKMSNLQDEKVLASPIGLIVLGGCLLIKNYSQIKFLGDFVYRYGYIFLVFGVSLIILILANIKLRKIKRL